jgi:hypothetical protein
LRKIDPIFRGAGFDMQDVRVVFNPVTYVVFDGRRRARWEASSSWQSRPRMYLRSAPRTQLN